MLNKAILVGRIGLNPELKTGQSGKAYCTFSLATTSGFGDSKQTEWHNVSAFGKTAENVCKFLKKGSIAVIEGRIQYQKYEKDGHSITSTRIVADDVKFISTKDNGSTHIDSANQAFQPMSNDTFEGNSIEDEPIPF